MRMPIILAAILLAGCLGGPSQTRITTVDKNGFFQGCPDSPCLADLNVDHVQLAKEKYGLEQITDDPFYHDPLNVQGDWLAFTVGHPTGATETRGNLPTAQNAFAIHGFNVKTRELVAISRLPQADSILPIARAGTVAFMVRPFSGNPYLAIWNDGTRLVTPLRLPENGTVFRLQSFDGTWIAFVGTVGNESGVWAWNLQNQALVLVRSAPFYDHFPDGADRTFTGISLSAGKAYYTIVGGLKGQRFNTTLYIMDLSTGAEQIFRTTPTMNTGANFVSAFNNMVALEGGGDIWTLNLNNGTFFQVNKASTGPNCFDTSLQGATLAFVCNKGGNSWGVAYGLVTGQQRIIAGGDLQVTHATTDGRQVIVEASGNVTAGFTANTDLFRYVLPLGFN